MIPRVYWTDNFQRDYRSYTGARQRAVAVVRKAVNRKEQLTDWYDGKRTLKGVDDRVYELKVTHSDRLLLRSMGNALCLVAMGDHDVTGRYAARSASSRREDFRTASPAPESFDPAYDAPLFVDIDEAPALHWAEELGQDWLHFLSDSQLDVKAALMTGIQARFSKGRGAPYVGLVAGGAGTGKTALLLNMALDFAEDGCKVDFRCSPSMQKYLQTYTGINMKRLMCEDGETPLVVFLDDPEWSGTVRQTVREARARGVRAIISGFDPLQWWSDKRLSTELDLLYALGEVQKLTTCYRQSTNLVEVARRVSRAVNEKSSWRAEFTAVHREREFLASLLGEYSDSLEPVKPGGRVITYVRGLDVAVAEEAQRLADATRWDDLPVLLVLGDKSRGVKIRREWKESLTGIPRIDCDVADVDRYRGLDFQSVWLFVSARLLRQLETGRVGLSSAEWAELRRLHIALTRAKDETILFAVET